jgi:hypothetical protein
VDKHEFMTQMRFRFMPGDPDMHGEHPTLFAGHYWVKYQIARQYKPQSIVEIGVHGAYSAWAMILGSGAKSYIGIDPYAVMDDMIWGKMQDKFHLWADTLLSSTKIPRFEIWLKDSQKMNSVPVADLYHVDGDHTFVGCLHDLYICFESLPVGKQILVDDFDFIPDVRNAVEKFCKENEDKLVFSYKPSLRGEIIITKTKRGEAACATP